jgi:hypothetical protein
MAATINVDARHNDKNPRHSASNKYVCHTNSFHFAAPGHDGRISECCDTCGIPYVTALDMNLVRNLRTIGFCTTKARVLGLYSLSQSHFKRSKVHPWLPMPLALFFERIQRHAPVYRHTKCTKMKSGLVFKNQSGLDNGNRSIPWMAPQCTIYMDGSP